MNKFKASLIVIVVFFFQLSVAQKSTISEKNIESKLSKSGNYFYNMECDKSLIFAKSALNDAYEINNNSLIALSYNIIALNFQEFSDAKQALSYFNKALEYSKLTDNDTIKNSIYNNLGSFYSYKLKDFKSSIQYYNQALIYSKKIKDSTEITYTQLNIASAYFAISDFKNGIHYLNDSKGYVTRKGELEAKISLSSLYGSYYSHINDTINAERFFKQAIEISKQNKSELVASNICEVYYDFSMHYKKNKDFEKANYYLTLYDSLKSKIYNDEKANSVQYQGLHIELDEYKRQVDKIDGEKVMQDKHNKESKLIIILFIFVVIILLLLMLTLYKNSTIRDKSNLELKKANEALVLAKESAEEASQMKSQFVSTITHELRTPLYGVIGITDIIVDEHKELANSPHLKSLKFSAKYLLSLVNDILQINKIDENRIVLESLIFNLTDEIATIKNSLDFIANRNHDVLIVEIDTAIPEFLIGDKLRLSQIIMNLASNALKFTKNGSVVITADLEKVEGTMNYITFKVKDTGIGIAKEYQDKIFDKFVQIERKEEDYQGTGLGLTIVTKLIDLFKSEIHLESEENVGTTFTFTIGFEYDEEKSKEIINNIEVDISSTETYNILVVEDNKINQVVTKKIIQNSNMTCTIVDDGYAAMVALDREHFDLILMDINMPLINGFETTRKIRAKGITIPIIALTAFDKQEVTEEAFSSGMNDIIVKPFEPLKLYQVISDQIDKREDKEL